MAKTGKIKRISINTFDRIKESTYEPVAVVQWNDIEISIKKTLSFKEMLQFVDEVSQLCFSDEGTYLPEVKDFIIGCNILEMYANFTLPASLDHKYELIYCTDAVHTVIKHINYNQFEQICNAIDVKIEHMAQSDLNELKTQMSEVFDEFTNLQNQFADIFEGIEPDGISKLMGAISDNQFSEEKIVQAYMSQSSSSPEDSNERNEGTE